MKADPKWSEVRCAQYDFSIEIAASCQRVWRGLTDQLNQWWLPDFRMLGTDSEIAMEPRAGGRLFEQRGEQFLLWYTVLAIEPYSSLDLSGSITAKYGGPVTTLLNATLTNDSPNSSTLRISDSLFGHVTEGLVDSLYIGWLALFNDGLKKYVEADGPS